MRSDRGRFVKMTKLPSEEEKKERGVRVGVRVGVIILKKQCSSVTSAFSIKEGGHNLN